jgi:hypothetical protein
MLKLCVLCCGVALWIVGGASTVAAQCVGAMYEDYLPPAVTGMSTTDPGYGARFWAWGDLDGRRGGSAQPVILDVDHGLYVVGLDWADADVCHQAGPVKRTAVLFESLGHQGYGRWALVNLAADASGMIAVDDAQQVLGGVQSRAVPVPQPWIEEVVIEPDMIELRLGWACDLAGESLSDLTGNHGEPLPSVRGFAVYVINAVVPTARPWDWSFGADIEPDAVNGFTTDSSATLRLPRSMWHDITVSTAVAITFDGNGDASGEDPESCSVHGQYLGQPSPWIRLPPLGVDVPVAMVGFEVAAVGDNLLRLGFEGQAEPAAASYRVWMLRTNGRRHLLQTFAGGVGSYDLHLELPPWCEKSCDGLSLEMLDAEGRVIDTAEVIGIR